MNDKEKEKFKEHMEKFSKEQLVGWVSAIAFILPMDEVDKNKSLRERLLAMFAICGIVHDKKE